MEAEKEQRQKRDLMIVQVCLHRLRRMGQGELGADAECRPAEVGQSLLVLSALGRPVHRTGNFRAVITCSALMRYVAYDAGAGKRILGMSETPCTPKIVWLCFGCEP